MDAPTDLDEEELGIVGASLEAQGCRELAAAYMAAAGIPLAPTIDDKILLHGYVAEELSHFERCADQYAWLGLGDLLARVEPRARALPTPKSWPELCIALFFFDRACTAHLLNHLSSRFRPLAELARGMAGEEVAHGAATAAALREACNTEESKREAQRHVDRWLRVALASLGRPDNARDERAVEIGIKARVTQALIDDYRFNIRVALGSCGLSISG